MPRTRTNTGEVKPKGTACNESHRQTVLFAVVGMSPAVLTQTIWALATSGKRPVLPDRVVVVTTTTGKESIARELFSPSATHGGRTVWDTLRDTLQNRGIETSNKLRFGTTGADIFIFTRSDEHSHSVEMDDIRTVADTETAADFILERLRPFTADDDVELICSITGGRKTTGAMLYACVSLICRDQDRLVHVLVNEPFENPRLQPKFHFPADPPQKHRVPDSTTSVTDDEARIELADVPFVPIRNLFCQTFGSLPGSFTNLVRKYRARIDEVTAPPQVELDDARAVAWVNGCKVNFSTTAYALFKFLVKRGQRGKKPAKGYESIIIDFAEFLEENSHKDDWSHPLSKKK